MNNHCRVLHHYFNRHRPNAKVITEAIEQMMGAKRMKRTEKTDQDLISGSRISCWCVKVGVRFHSRGIQGGLFHILLSLPTYFVSTEVPSLILSIFAKCHLPD